MFAFLAIDVLEDNVLTEQYQFEIQTSQDQTNSLKDYYSSFNNLEEEVNSSDMSLASFSGPSLAVTPVDCVSDADAKSGKNLKF